MMYIQMQKTNLRAGWWGLISPIYTVFSLIRNRIEISKHRRALPLIVLEEGVFQRPFLKVPKSVYIVPLAIIVCLSAGLWAPKLANFGYRNDRGEVIRNHTATKLEIQVGDCFLIDWTDYDNQETYKGEKLSSSYTLVPCSDPHPLQVYALGKFKTYPWNESKMEEEVNQYCLSDTNLSKINSVWLANLNADDFEWFGPPNKEQYDLDKTYLCVIDKPDTVTWSFLD